MTKEPSASFIDAVWSKARSGDEAAGVHFFRAQQGDYISLPYVEFLRRSFALAKRLPPRSSEERRILLIAANQPSVTLLAFFAALCTGTLPLVLPSAKALGSPAALAECLQNLASELSGYASVALEEGVLPSDAVLPDMPIVRLPPQLDDYPAQLYPSTAFGRDPGDIAFLQMTSASTGRSKLLAISHANISANLEAIRDTLHGGAHESVASWLPLCHDMGLVGTTLFSFFHGYPLYVMSPAEFVKRPSRWLRTMSEKRCTMTAAPNFGFEYAERFVTEQELQGLDLSGLRAAMIGAEPIRLSTLEAFLSRFSGVGFRAQSFVPSYGLAESTLAVALDGEPVSPRVAKVALRELLPGHPVRVLAEGRLGVGDIQAVDGVSIISVGRVVAGLTFELLDDDGVAVSGEGRLGEIVLRGSSLSLGYFDVERGPEPFERGALRTGDLGFVLNGELFVVERKKNVIIRNGRNFAASLLEDKVAAILDRSPQDVVVLDENIHDPASKIVAIVENYMGPSELPGESLSALRALDLPISELRIARKRVIPRTTSGKKKYYLCRQRLVDPNTLYSQILSLAGAE